MNSLNSFHFLILLLIAGLILVLYLYAKTYKNLLQAIGSGFTPLNPNLPYLIYVPVVGLIFYAVMAFSLKKSLSCLHQAGRIPIKTDAVFKSLLAFCMCMCMCMVLAVIPWIEGSMLLASIICWGFNWWHAISTKKLVLMGRLERARVMH